MTHGGLWNVDTGGGTPSSNTGPSGGEGGTSDDNYAHIETSSGSSGYSSTLTSVGLDMSTSAGYVSFYYHMFGGTIGSLTVNVCNDTACVLAWNTSGQQHTSLSALWTHRVAVLPVGTTSVQWVATRTTSFTGDISIDTVRIGQGAFTFAPTTAPTTAPPTAPTVPTFVVAASTPAGACSTTQGGLCVTDGAGEHGNNERCTFTALRSFMLSVDEWDTETFYDTFTINSVVYSGAQSPVGVTVAAGTNFTWSSDGSVTNDGFTLCADGTAAPTVPATPAPTSAAPTPAGPWAAPVGAYHPSSPFRTDRSLRIPPSFPEFESAGVPKLCVASRRIHHHGPRTRMCNYSQQLQI
jgi:hypothetical protein